LIIDEFLLLINNLRLCWYDVNSYCGCLTKFFNNTISKKGAVGYLYTAKVIKGKDVNIEIGHKQKYKHEHEVVTSSDGIPPEDIMGAQAIDIDGKAVGDFIKNPGFKKL